MGGGLTSLQKVQRLGKAVWAGCRWAFVMRPMGEDCADFVIGARFYLWEFEHCQCLFY